MKKLALLTCALLSIGSIAQAKEIVQQPVITSSKEVISEPVEVIEEVTLVTEAPAPVIAEQLPSYINLRVGGDVWSRYSKHEFLNKNTKDLGYEIAAEAYKPYQYVDLGLGVAYQSHAKRDGSADGGEYKSIPVYLTARHNMDYFNLPFTPYLKANAGYSFNFDQKDINSGIHKGSASIDDGAYWAAGLGAEYQNVNVDVLYGVNYAKLKTNNEKIDNNYQRVTLSVGYKFDI
ncbi:outer membrane beta-barrel protein [uncultured Cetobacterium sp.]|uniref:outer membrane protein n=1 Tax=uncultured Cetobacterium sp. TaxID=527638 RepID=UPI00261EB94B|nr:outer membrane beta-barrel protein [uncultured Cetobacterium sp.]